MTAFKICGVSTPETVDASVAVGAAFLGLNFFARSPRYLGLDLAAMLSARVPAHVGKVGVFVDPDDDYLDEVCTRAGLDAIQLHDIAPAKAARIGARHGLPVWAAIGVSNSDDIRGARHFMGAAECLLFDAKTPKGAHLPGGMGLRFDWRLMGAARDIGLPWGLAGGLDPGNVGEAIGVSGAALVDVSSGVEDGPGVKSVEKIKAFADAVRAA